MRAAFLSGVANESAASSTSPLPDKECEHLEYLGTVLLVFI